MTTELIHDRGRGPEFIGTRITVYNLLPYLLDPTATEEYICRVNDLSPEQVAAARAYVLNNPAVLVENARIEKRMAAKNSPQVLDRAEQTHARFLSFRQWLTERELEKERKTSGKPSISDQSETSTFPSYREWLAKRDAGSTNGP